MASGRRPIRIVRLIARLNTGGPAIHTVLLTGGLNGERFSSTLVTGVVSRGEGDMGPFATERGVQPVVIPELQRNPKPLNDLRALLRICRVVFATRPAIVHTHTAKAGALGRIAAFIYNLSCPVAGRRRAVVCHTFHGHLFHGYFPRWISMVLVVGERLLARLTDQIVTVSEQTKHELTHVYRICAEDKCVVIPVGLDFGWTRDLPAVRGILRREAGVPPDSLAIGIVGRLTAIKNHELFLRGADACRVPGARFFVIGDGERRDELMALSNRLGLDGRVVFTGWQRDPAKVYSNLDIACLTSLNEGTPVALIEAMAAGLPVLATNVGGMRDLMVGERVPTAPGFEVFENGILVPCDRPDLLGRALEFLAERPELRQTMGASGRAFVRDRFSADRLVFRMEALYLDLLRDQGAEEFR